MNDGGGRAAGFRAIEQDRNLNPPAAAGVVSTGEDKTSTSGFSLTGAGLP